MTDKELIDKAARELEAELGDSLSLSQEHNLTVRHFTQFAAALREREPDDQGAQDVEFNLRMGLIQDWEGCWFNPFKAEPATQPTPQPSPSEVASATLKVCSCANCKEWRESHPESGQ